MIQGRQGETERQIATGRDRVLQEETEGDRGRQRDIEEDRGI